MKIHILGIGGTFMAGVAIIAKQLGHTVTGSDKNLYDPMKSVLIKEGIKFTEGYNSNILKKKIDLVVVGNVMSRGADIIEKLLEKNINFTSGPQWLHDNVLKNKNVIAVSGTHGKTTTSSLLTWILKYSGFNPSYLIGGLPNNFNSPAKLTKSKYFVIEADEYDTAFFDKRSKFIHYNPNILIINNIEFDHADIFENIESIIKSFHHLVRLIPQKGNIVYDHDDDNIKKLFRLGSWSNLVPLSLKNKKDAKWKLTYQGEKYLLNKKELKMDMIGIHNFKNASLAIIAASLIKIPISKSLNAIKEFSGVSRRMEKIDTIKNLPYKGFNNTIDVFDDFAHHPTEIKYSITSLKEKYKGKKLLSICEIKSNSMLRGTHKEELYSALKISDSSLVISTKKINWKFNKNNNNKISMITSYVKINDYIRKNITNIDLILIMSNVNTKNIVEHIRNEKN